MALLCHVRALCPVALLIDVAMRYIADVMIDADAADASTYSTHIPFLINGITVGFVSPRDADRVLASLREARRTNALPFDASVYKHHSFSLNLDCDAGCLLAPVLVVDRLRELPEVMRRYDGRPNTALLWNELVSRGVVVYLDNSEEETMLIADSAGQLAAGGKPYTHVEIHPSLINGASPSPPPRRRRASRASPPRALQASAPASSPSATTTRRRGTATRAPWASRPWGCTPGTTGPGWTSSPTCSTTRRDRW